MVTAGIVPSDPATRRCAPHRAAARPSSARRSVAAPIGGRRRGVMKSPTYITTSWDDGHPLDLRVADLLARYGIAGTFYVPATTAMGTMSAAQFRELIPNFEIGAHTLR